LSKLPAGDQILANDLRDRDPEQVFTAVPYVKGRLFLNYLDAKFGRERFDAFLKGYFDHFAFKSVTTEQFLAYLQENLLNKFPGIVSREQVNAWVLSPGLPADAVLPATTLFAQVDEARTAWLAGNLPPKKLGADWNVQQWLYFLENMPSTLNTAQLADLDKAFNFTKSENAEVASSWFKLVIAHDYQPSYPRLEDYLKSIGRTKLIKPLYEGLMNTGSGQTFAKRVFGKAELGYHPETVTAIEAIVEPDKNKDEDSEKSE
jgi:leukotriene-A4 hydrolase